MPAQAVQGGPVRPGEEEVSAGWQRVCTCGQTPPTYFCYSCMAFAGNRQGEPGQFSRPRPEHLAAHEQAGEPVVGADGKTPVLDSVTGKQITVPEPEKKPETDWRNVGTLGH